MRFFILSLLMALCSLLYVQDAFAQFREEDRLLRDLLVRERTPSDFRAEGFSFRGFEVAPSLMTNFVYDDNIFADEAGAVDDYYMQVIPSLKVIKPVGPHSFNLKLTGDLRRYASIENENANNYSLETEGFLSATNDLSFFYGLTHGRSALSRAEPGESQFSRVPITVKADRLEVAGNYRFNRLNLSLQGNLSRLTYEDGESATTGNTIIAQDRNRKDQGVTLRASYDVFGQSRELPEHVLFAQASHTKQRYDEVIDGNGQITAGQRNNDESGILLGIDTRYKGLVIGRAAVGYFFRDFEQDDDVDRFDYELDLAFNVMPKLTLFLSGDRTVNQDNAFLTGVVRTSGELAAEYEFLHNLYGGAKVGYTMSDFTGDREGREDEDVTLGLNLRYLHSPYFQSNLSFEAMSRSSNTQDVDFDRNIFMYSLLSQY